MPALLSSSQAPSRRSNPISNQPRTTKHPAYYMPDGNVVIQVQNTLFKLDLSVLHEKSPVLRSIVPPVYAGKTRFLGFNDEHPFKLRELSEYDFVRLLWILYPSASQPWNLITVDEWLAVLRVSSKYEMDDVRDLTALRLHALPIDPIRKITIWEQYHLDQSLLVSCYAGLCQRTEPITLSMAMTLGIKNFTKLAAARDMYHQKIGCGSCVSYTTEEKQAIAEEVVSKAFAKNASRKSWP